MTIAILCAWFADGFACLPFITMQDCLDLESRLPKAMVVETSCEERWIQPAQFSHLFKPTKE